MQVACNSQRDLQDWLDLLTKHTHTPAHTHRPPCHTVTPHGRRVFIRPLGAPPPPDLPLLSPPPSQLPSHTVTSSRHSEARAGSSAYHTLPHLSSCETSHSAPSWGPLEPPSTPKPWSLSCLRPAPPLRPSAALCFKEVLNKPRSAGTQKLSSQRNVRSEVLIYVFSHFYRI